MSQYDSSQPQLHDSGSFLTGFTIGVFAGAAGYFLFGTSRGKKVREAVTREWNEAQAKLTVDRGEQVGHSLGETIREVVREVVKKVEEGQQEAERVTSKNTRTPSRKNATTAAKKVTRFKGT